MHTHAWLDLSFTFSGARLVTPPAALVVAIESWTPERGGWAFAHPESLHIQSGDSLWHDVLRRMTPVERGSP